jgi:FixJ family two-component response regulator
MRTQYPLKLASANGFTRPRRAVRTASGVGAPDLQRRTILLISDDTDLHQNLRCVANSVGRMVVRVAGATDIVRMTHVVRAAAVLLDLDLPAGAAWQTADKLLQEKNYSPIILLTARSERFDVRTAILAGCIVEKSAGPTRLLEVVEQILAESDAAQVERNALQRVVINWLSPSSQSLPLATAYRCSRGIE